MTESEERKPPAPESDVAAGAADAARGRTAQPGGGRVEEFIDLYTRHELRLRAFALSLVPRWEDAAEVYQQSSLVLWRNFESFEAGSNFFAWASKIIYRKAKDFRKGDARRKAHFSDQVLETIATRSVDLSAQLDERQAALDRCLSRLKPEQRRMLSLRYEEGASVESVAEAMGRTADAVYKALNRIRKSLWECVNRTLGIGGLA